MVKFAVYTMAAFAVCVHLLFLGMMVYVFKWLTLPYLIGMVIAGSVLPVANLAFGQDSFVHAALVSRAFNFLRFWR